ncbi:hypothetical protein [Psychromonas sp. SP041]|uniref:hypothetical protein n=1 Tax=Psychromonas sp. SP041 TaxID=1365007 RepID=UPI0010C79C8D|nr:hypothetical protein [Psychromonas sp. SP041]
MFNSNALFALVLVLLSSPASAFPVIVGSMASNIIVLLLSAFGLAKTNKEKNKGMFILFGVIVIFLGFNQFKNSELSTLSLEHEYFSGQVNTIAPDELYLSDGTKSLKSIREGNADYIIVSDAKTQYIPGSHIIYFGDKEAISLFSKNTNKPIYIFSRYRTHGANVAAILNENNAMSAVVDSAFLFSNLSGSDVLSDQMNETLSIDDIQYSPIYPKFSAIQESLKDENQFVVTDTNQFKVHSYMNASLLTVVDIAAMTDSDWLKIKEGMNPKLRTRFSFAYNLGDGNIQALVKYASTKLTLPPNKIVYSKTYLNAHPFTELASDNQITPVFYKSTTWLSPLDIYALPEIKNKKVTIGCFTRICTERIPHNGGDYLVRDLTKYNPFTLKNWKLTVEDIPFDKDEIIVLAPEDSNTSLLSYYLAYELDRKMFNFLGFTHSNNELFGGAYFLGGDRALGDSFLIDSSKLSMLLEVTKFTNSWTDIKPLWVTSSTLIIMGIALGAVSLLGGLWAVGSAIVFGFLSIYFNTLFRLPSDVYQHMAVNPLVLTALASFYFILEGGLKPLFKYRWKGLIGALVIFTILLEIMSYTSSPFDRIYLGLFVTLILGSLIVELNNKLMYVPSKVGDKYMKTIPFLKKHSFLHQGFIVKHKTKNIPFTARMLGARKWIVRSNHISSDEQANAGIFETKITSRRKLAQTIKLMKKNLINTLPARDVQFWVMPYINYSKKGVARSHADESGFSISYSIDDEDLVTEGLSGSYRTFHRNHKKTSLEKKIMTLIVKVESYYNKPALIEFGITRLSNIKLLQVRIDEQTHPAFDSEILSAWRDSHRFADNVESSYMSPLGRSVLAKLYNYSIIMDHQHVYRIKEATKPFNYMDAINALNEIKEIHKNIDDHIHKMDLNTFIRQIAHIVEPVSNCITSDKINKDYDGLESLSLDIYSFMSITGGTLASMDITEPWRSFSIQVTASEREVCKSIMMLGLAMCKYFYEKSGINIDHNLSISSHLLSRKGEPLSEATNSLDGWVIVNGEMPIKRVGIDDFKDIPEHELKNYTLMVKSFPNSSMNMIGLFGGVISRDGSPMSHLAITAKNCKVPCRIGTKFYEPIG